jgi:cephalosporin hydroxylase
VINFQEKIVDQSISNPVDTFNDEKRQSISTYKNEVSWRGIGNEWLIHAFKKKYMYNFESMGRPIIQMPNDMIAFQEIVWEVKPDLIIETGIAHGGSLIYSASLLALLDMCDAIESGKVLDPRVSNRKVVGIDIDIREHNRRAIEAHPMSSRIQMIQGSSIEPDTVSLVKDIAADYKRVLVCLDSNHTHAHVLEELQAYARLTSVNSYCIVFDTIVEDMPGTMFPDRPWAPGNSPKTAVWAFLNSTKDFVVDKDIDAKLQISCAPDGFLKRIK